jgi:hypothetical protein
MAEMQVPEIPSVLALIEQTTREHDKNTIVDVKTIRRGFREKQNIAMLQCAFLDVAVCETSIYLVQSVVNHEQLHHNGPWEGIGPTSPWFISPLTLP